MKKALILIENGSEELEFIAPVDILRRGGVKVDLVSANKNKEIQSSHGVKIIADKTIYDIENVLEYDAIIIPGGLPGATNLKDNNLAVDFFKTMSNNNKLVCAICASPIVLNKANITKDKNITCYPGFEKQITYKKYDDKAAVVIDKNVITGQGPTLSLLFGYEILNKLLGKETTDKVKKEMLLNVLKNNL